MSHVATPAAQIAEPLEILRRTPAVVDALLRGLPDSWTDTADTPEGWRPRDVVGHLISGEETAWITRAQRILEDGPSVPFDAFDRTAMLERDKGVPLDTLLDRFIEMRAESVAQFEGLVKDDDLGKLGMHPSLGEVSMDNLLNTWAVHDLDHVSQIFAGLAGSHDADVGPWKHYLGILLRRTDPAAQPG